MMGIVTSTKSFKEFKTLAKGDVFYNSIGKCWLKATGLPEPLDDSNLDGLWEISTNRGRQMAFPSEPVTLKK